MLSKTNTADSIKTSTVNGNQPPIPSFDYIDYFSPSIIINQNVWISFLSSPIYVLEGGGVRIECFMLSIIQLMMSFLIFFYHT